MNPVAIAPEKWSSIRSENPMKINNMVFSPSGRWAVDVLREGTPGNIEGVFVHIFDMATMSYKRYVASMLKAITKVLEKYWVSEDEFVIIDDLGQRRNQFDQIFCHVDHEKCCIVPFFGKSVTAMYPSPKFLPQNRGANPLLCNGKRHHMLIKGEHLILIPWYGSYQDGNDEVLTIHMPMCVLDDLSTYELAYCQDSKIFMPLKQHFQNPETGVCFSHRYVVDEMFVIDVNKLNFENGFADIRENDDAIGTLVFKHLNEEHMRNPTASVYFRQTGHYLLGYTVDPQPFNPLAQSTVKEQIIFMINLKEFTISSTTVTSGASYFPTVYRDQLFVVRNAGHFCRKQRVEIWTNEFTMKPVIKLEVPTLLELAQAAVVRYSVASDPVLAPFIFPEAHCCIRSENCFCEGILKSLSPSVTCLKANIINSLAYLCDFSDY